MQLFFDRNIKEEDNQFTFSKAESKHIIRVLRIKINTILFITNGNGFLFETILINNNDKKCIVKIVNVNKIKNDFSYNLHIAIAPTKNNQRLEWFLEKATEIGISEITPIICSNSERKIIKPERLNKVLIAAMKQANRLYLPKLNKAISFKNFMNIDRNDFLYIAHCKKTNKKKFKNEIRNNSNNNSITILIGPEGDFSLAEIALALQNKYIAVSLGDSRLRTETAGIVATHSVSLLQE